MNASLAGSRFCAKYSKSSGDIGVSRRAQKLIHFVQTSNRGLQRENLYMQLLQQGLLLGGLQTLVKGLHEVHT